MAVLAPIPLLEVGQEAFSSEEFLAGCNSRVASCRVRTAARMFNNHIRGWINYYGRFYKSALYPALRHIDRILARWAHRKFKSLSGRHVAARPAALGFFFISL